MDTSIYLDGQHRLDRVNRHFNNELHFSWTTVEIHQQVKPQLKLTGRWNDLDDLQDICFNHQNTNHHIFIFKCQTFEMIMSILITPMSMNSSRLFLIYQDFLLIYFMILNLKNLSSFP